MECRIPRRMIDLHLRPCPGLRRLVRAADIVGARPRAGGDASLPC